jgi:hypothetical protein
MAWGRKVTGLGEGWSGGRVGAGERRAGGQKSQQTPGATESSLDGSKTLRRQSVGAATGQSSQVATTFALTYGGRARSMGFFLSCAAAGGAGDAGAASLRYVSFCFVSFRSAAGAGLRGAGTGAKSQVCTSLQRAWLAGPPATRGASTARVTSSQNDSGTSIGHPYRARKAERERPPAAGTEEVPSTTFRSSSRPAYAATASTKTYPNRISALWEAAIVPLALGPSAFPLPRSI